MVVGWVGVCKRGANVFHVFANCLFSMYLYGKQVKEIGIENKKKQQKNYELNVKGSVYLVFCTSTRFFGNPH